MLWPALVVDALSAAHEAELSAANDAVDIEAMDRNAAIAVNRYNFLVILTAPYAAPVAKRENLVYRLTAQFRVLTRYTSDSFQQNDECGQIAVLSSECGMFDTLSLLIIRADYKCVAMPSPAEPPRPASMML